MCWSAFCYWALEVENKYDCIHTARLQTSGKTSMECHPVPWKIIWLLWLNQIKSLKCITQFLVVCINHMQCLRLCSIFECCFLFCFHTQGPLSSPLLFPYSSCAPSSLPHVVPASYWSKAEAKVPFKGVKFYSGVKQTRDWWQSSLQKLNH